MAGNAKTFQALPAVPHSLMEFSPLNEKNLSRPKRFSGDLIKAGLFGIVLGYLLALILSRSVWLEMRFNIGLVIPGFTLLCILLSLCKKITIRYSVFSFLELLSVATSLLIYRFESGALLVIPACLFREGCSLSSVSLDTINIILGLTLFAGNFIWIFHEIHLKVRRRVDF